MLSRAIWFSPNLGDLEHRRVETLAPRPLLVVQSGSGESERAAEGVGAYRRSSTRDPIGSPESCASCADR